MLSYYVIINLQYNLDTLHIYQFHEGGHGPHVVFFNDRMLVLYFKTNF